MNQQGDVIALVDGDGNRLVKYRYDAWGRLLSYELKDETIKVARLYKYNALQYRSYYYDSDLLMYDLGSRFYDPVLGRFLNADDVDTLSTDCQNFIQYNLYAYCWNNPVNMTDDTGTWPNWAKVAVGAVATVAAVAITVTTGGTAIPVIAGVAVSTAGGAISGYISGGKQGAIDGAATGFMLGGLSALASSAIGAIKAVKTAKQGVAIGEKMAARVEPFAKANNLSTYKGIKGYKALEKIVGKNTASKIGMAHNKSWITRQVKLGTKIFDIGPAGSRIASPFYAMERGVVKGYFNYFKCF